MNNTEIQELRSSLNTFIHAIKTVQEHDYEAHQSIHRQYRELYHLYTQLSEEDIAINFEASEIQLIQYFHLGMEYENQFNELLQRVQVDCKETLAFIGSNKGFHLLNGNRKEIKEYSEDELKIIFGSLFGIQLSKECVNALRAEKIASILGYALSGRFEQLKPSLEGLSDIEKLEVLRRDIHEQEVCMKYTYREVDNGLEVGIDFEGRKNANKIKSSVSPKGEPDTCFVNTQTKTLHVGFATSNINTEQQGYAFFKAFASVNALTQVDTFASGAQNNWFGYTLKPYMLLNSPFSLESDDYQTGSRFKGMLNQCSITELKAINQLPWFRIVANCANTTHLESVIQHDVYMVGCDTTNINMMLKNIRELPQEQQVSALRDYVLESITTVVHAVNRNTLSFEHGTKLRLHIMLDNMLDSTKSILQKSKMEIDDAYFDRVVQPLQQGFKQLLENVESSSLENQSKTDVMNKMAGLVDDLESVHYCNRMIRQDRSKPIQQVVYVGNKTLYPVDNLASDENFLNSLSEINALALQDAERTLQEVFPRRASSIISQFKDYKIHRDEQMKKDLYNNLSNAMSELKKKGYSKDDLHISTLKNIRDLLMSDKKFYGVISTDMSDDYMKKLLAHIELKKELEQFSF